MRTQCIPTVTTSGPSLGTSSNVAGVFSPLNNPISVVEQALCQARKMYRQRHLT